MVPPPAAPTGRSPSLGDGLPPLHVPLRFFATAALFGVLGGLLWMREGELAFATRWSTTMLATTHLFVLGFLTMVVFGALFQVVPVLGGGALPRAELVAGLVHPGLTAGTLCLASGLWRAHSGLLLAAIVVLGATFTVFGLAVGRQLVVGRAPALRPPRLALLAFAGTIALGLLMAVALVDPALGIPFRNWTNVHATWGSVGFGFVLVVGVGHQVVPMFHVTPPFPPRIARWTAPAIGVGLLLLLAPAPGGPLAGTAVLGLAGSVHAVTTLRLLARRRRRRPDATVRGWQCGLALAMTALLLAAADALLPAATWPESLGGRLDLLVAVLFGLGGLGTIVMGMLPKIVAFLAFLHLQRRCVTSRAAAAHLPTMDGFVGQRTAATLLGLHLLAVAVAAGAAFSPGLGPAAGAAVVAEFTLLLAILLAAALRYHHAAGRIAIALAAGHPTP